MKTNKFKLSSEFKINEEGVKLFRIVALTSFLGVTAGDVGGWVESESNLSQHGNAWVYDNAQVYGNARVYGDTRVSGNAQVYDNARVYGDARVSDCGDIISIHPIGSEAGTFTAFKCVGGDIMCSRGCFSGSLEDFAKAVAKTHGGNKYGRQYAAVIDLVKIKLTQ